MLGRLPGRTEGQRRYPSGASEDQPGIQSGSSADKARMWRNHRAIIAETDSVMWHDAEP